MSTIQKDIKMNFGEGKFVLNFGAKQKQWASKIKEPVNDDDYGEEDDQQEDETYEDLIEQQQALRLKIGQLIDVKDRLVIQKDASKLCVAESIKDFHEQMQLVLREKVDLNQLGPELVSIDRQRLAT